MPTASSSHSYQLSWSMSRLSRRKIFPTVAPVARSTSKRNSLSYSRTGSEPRTLPGKTWSPVLTSVCPSRTVRYALEGGVRKAGDRLRITAHLMDTATDQQLWSGRFDGTVDDVFGFQDDAAQGIVHALSIELSADESRALREHPIRDARAYELFLRARHAAWSFSPDGLARAKSYIESAKTHTCSAPSPTSRRCTSSRESRARTPCARSRRWRIGSLSSTRRRHPATG